MSSINSINKGKEFLYAFTLLKEGTIKDFRYKDEQGNYYSKNEIEKSKKAGCILY